MSDYFTSPEFIRKLSEAVERRFEEKRDGAGQGDRYFKHIDEMNNLKDPAQRLEHSINRYLVEPEGSVVGNVCLRDIRNFPQQDVEKILAGKKVRHDMAVALFKSVVQEIMERPEDDTERVSMEKGCPDVMAKYMHVMANLDRLLILNHDRNLPGYIP